MKSNASDFRIRWAPKLRPERLAQLYRTDALGLRDPALISEVGDMLLRRCESIILVSSWRFVCPRCGDVVATDHGKSSKDEDVISCPGCLWSSTRLAIHRSWQHLDLFAGNDQGAFQRYVDTYPQAGNDTQKMLAIDALIHDFHQFLASERPHRLVAVNLIEGNHKQVLVLLDTLAYGDASSAGIANQRQQWDERRQIMNRG